jgi:hypothetical protein
MRAQLHQFVDLQANRSREPGHDLGPGCESQWGRIRIVCNKRQEKKNKSYMRINL